MEILAFLETGHFNTVWSHNAVVALNLNTCYIYSSKPWRKSWKNSRYVTFYSRNPVMSTSVMSTTRVMSILEKLQLFAYIFEKWQLFVYISEKLTAVCLHFWKKNQLFVYNLDPLVEAEQGPRALCLRFWKNGLWRFGKNCEKFLRWRRPWSSQVQRKT